MESQELTVMDDLVGDDETSVDILSVTYLGMRVDGQMFPDLPLSQPGDEHGLNHLK